MSGEIEQAERRAWQAFGDLTDDEKLQTEGEADGAAGKDKIGDVEERVDDAVDAVPDRIS